MMMTKNAYCVFDPPSAALVVPGLGTVARREMCRLFTAGPGSNSLSRKRLLYSAGGPTQASDDDSGHSVPLTIGREGVDSRSYHEPMSPVKRTTRLTPDQAAEVAV